MTKGDTTVTFETVTDSGSTTVCVTDEPSAETPQGFQFLGDYYDISTGKWTTGWTSRFAPLIPSTTSSGASAPASR